MGDLLQLNPPELRFKFELRKNIPVTLSLYNPGDETVAFKVKTTAPKKYCVRPSSGTVEPKTSKEIQVIMQAQREPPPNYSDCKDKFLVQGCLVPKDAKDVSGDVFERATDVKQTKLRVILTTPPKPPSPVPEGDEGDNSGGAVSIPAAREEAADQGPQDAASLTSENKQLREYVRKLESDRNVIKRQLDLWEEQGRGGGAGGKQASGIAAGGFTLIHLLIATVVALGLGYFLHK
ncbi:hypothetical protein WJX73_006347 [Symbiochloris irregularis]|uniref:MSP domain-containing protein n=1 Tax=Symbiochloris irregularis TaxID=706552 RepID=A0AAW1P0H5_9CHLO